MKQSIIFLGVSLLLFAVGIEANIFPIVNSTSICSSKKPCVLAWVNDANLPPVSKLPKAQVNLMVGPNDNQIEVLDLGTVSPKVGKIVYNIPPTLGPPGKFYFYKFTLQDPSMDPIWSTRFVIQDIQGNIPGFDPKTINGTGEPTNSTGPASPGGGSNSTTAAESNIASPILSANKVIGLSMAAMAAVYLY